MRMQPSVMRAPQMHRNPICASKKQKRIEENLMKIVGSRLNSRVTASSRQVLPPDDMMPTADEATRLSLHSARKSLVILSEFT